MLLVSAKAEQKSLDDFIKFMKANPDKVTIGTPGNYNLNHIFASMTARAAGVNFRQRALHRRLKSGCRSARPARRFRRAETVGDARPDLRKACSSPIGIFANARLEMFPDVPTFKDKGFDVFPYGPVVQMAYIVAPAKPARGCQDNIDHRVPRRDPGSALQGIRREERVPGRRDLTGDALAKEVDSVAAALGTVAQQVFPKE